MVSIRFVDVVMAAAMYKNRIFFYLISRADICTSYLSCGLSCSTQEVTPEKGLMCRTWLSGSRGV